MINKLSQKKLSVGWIKLPKHLLEKQFQVLRIQVDNGTIKYK